MATPDNISAPPACEATGEVAGKLCSICQTPIIAGEQVVSCPHCVLPFHQECWTENRGCSAYGCAGSPKLAKGSETNAGEPLSNAWGGEKPCPLCGRQIKAQALKCRFCGAEFNTRDIVSKAEYQRREYEGAEYTEVRNKVVALFLLSVAACLAPVGLVLMLVLFLNKEFWGIDYRRLPVTLRALVISAIGVSSFLMLLLVLLLIFD
jgi:hypothetical protein